eukprot:TRINITY_DN8419_c1_g1_i1.p3 TRINITY_DN8419_c1_g1~~TRINITY_DN8419_c1_g1_i1.p3  ORF type:complete len:151 (-),score=13.39 TRINITY_DN8419_c1_g1_i1:23-475(-)
MRRSPLLVYVHKNGQLITVLRNFKQDLHWYLRQLEEVAIQALDQTWGIRGNRISGLPGVWVGNEKIAATGIRAQKWVTYHGIAINVCMDMQPFEQIIPCGIQEYGVTSVRQLVGQQENMVLEMYYGVLDAFKVVFNVEYVMCEKENSLLQ